MTPGGAALLGVVQGLTEFLPVSSDGHLALAQVALGLADVPILFDILLHAGTLAVVLLWFRGDIAALLRARDVGYGAKIVLAGALTLAVALPLEKTMEKAFHDVRTVGTGFLVSAAFLLATLRRGAGGRTEPSWRDALLVGLVQGLAPFPGVSRSGLTISAALLSGMEGAAAMRFSFILSLPTVGGAVFLKVLEGGPLGAGPVEAAIGVAAAAASGTAAVALLSRAVRPGVFHLFGWYCLAVGAVAWMR